MLHSTPSERNGRRYELKLTVSRWELARVRAWLRAHRGAFWTPYPSRRVNSVYFDTPELSSFQENLAGVPSRCKLRLRWYGDGLTDIAGTLELKIKQGALGWKRQHALSRPLSLDRAAWCDLLAELRGQSPPLWRNHLDAAGQPTVMTRYHRAYYTSADAAVRITVDWDQLIYDQRRSRRPNLRRPTPLEDRVIIELKCAASDRDKLAEVAAGFPLRVERCSKYVSGVWAVLAH